VGAFDALVLQLSGADALPDAALEAALDAADAAVAAGAARAYGLHARDWHALERGAGGAGCSLPRLLRLLAARGAAAAARCVAISSPASLAAPGPLLAGAGGAPSVAALAAREGLAVLLTAPLDCQLPARAYEAALAARDGAAAAAAAAAAPAAAAAAGGVRPFRCVDAPLHVDRHPARTAALLNDIVNFAIHCELLWERRVRALVADERALEARAGVAAAGGGAGSDGARAAPLPLSALLDTDVAWAQLLLSRLAHPGFFTLQEWLHVKHTRLLPALARLAAAVQGVEPAREWATCYRGLMAELADKVETTVEQRHGHQARALGAALLADAAAADAGAPHAAALPPPPPPDARHWGRAAAPPLAAVVARLLLAFPNTVLVSEVPDLHRLASRASARVRVEEAAGAALGGGAAPPPAPAAAELPAPPAFSARTAHAVLAAAAARGRVLDAATAPLPDWADPLQGTPTQAELAPLQEAMRKLDKALPPLAH
jgi:hypothetical protein